MTLRDPVPRQRWRWQWMPGVSQDQRGSGIAEAWATGAVGLLLLTQTSQVFARRPPIKHGGEFEHGEMNVVHFERKSL